MNISEELSNMLTKHPEIQVDTTSIESLIDFVQSLDVSKYHYEWTFDDITYNNFEGFEVYVEDKESVFECYIWMNLSLDPPRLIASNIRLSRDEAIMASIDEFAVWYNNYIKEQEQQDWLIPQNTK